MAGLAFLEPAGDSGEALAASAFWPDPGRELAGLAFLEPAGEALAASVFWPDPGRDPAVDPGGVGVLALAPAPELGRGSVGVAGLDAGFSAS